MTAEIVAYLLVLTKVMGNWLVVLATAPSSPSHCRRSGRLVRAGSLPRPGEGTSARARDKVAVPAPVSAEPLVEGVADARP